MVERAHEHHDVDRPVLERQALRAADEKPGAASVVAFDRLRHLGLRDLHAGHLRAALAQRADERAGAAADVDDVLSGRGHEPFEHRQIADHLASHRDES